MKSYSVWVLHVGWLGFNGTLKMYTVGNRVNKSETKT